MMTWTEEQLEALDKESEKAELSRKLDRECELMNERYGD